MKPLGSCFETEEINDSFIQTLYRNRRRLRDEISNINSKETGNVQFDPSKLVAGIVAFTDENSEFELLEENEAGYVKQQQQENEVQGDYKKYSIQEEETIETHDIPSCFEEYLKQMPDRKKEIVFTNAALFDGIVAPHLYNNSKSENNNNSPNHSSSVVLPTASSTVFLSSKSQQEQGTNEMKYGGRGEEEMPQDFEPQRNYHIEAKQKEEEEVLSDIESETSMTCSEKTVDLVNQIRDVERLVRRGETSEFTLNMIRKIAQKNVKNTIMMSTPNKQLYSATVVASLDEDPIDKSTGTTAVSFGWTEEEAVVNAVEMLMQMQIKKTTSLSRMTSTCASRSDLADL